MTKRKTKPKPKPKPKPAAFQFGPLKVFDVAGDGKFFWNLKARNGRLVADGCEEYSSKRKAIAGFRAAAKLAAKALAELEGK